MRSAISLVLALALLPSQPAPAATSGVVSDGATGRPIPGVVVSLSGGGEPPRNSVTDSKGRFVFRGLPPADGYSLDASKAGYVGGRLVTRAVFTAGASFSLSEGEWFPNANLVLWATGGISGTVVDQRGEPVVDQPVRVLMQVPVAGTTHWANGPVAHTDDRGIYRIAGLPMGTYVVHLPAPAVTALSDDHRVYPAVFYPSGTTLSAASPVTLDPGEERTAIDMTLHPVSTVRVEGRLVGPPAVVSGLVIRMLPAGSESLGIGAEQSTAVAAADGRFVLPAVPAGSYTLSASTSVAQYVRSQHITGPLRPPGSLSFAYMAFAPGAIGETFFQQLRTPSRESYSGTMRVDVESDAISGVEVDLQRGVTLSGRIVRADGGALPRSVTLATESATGDVRFDVAPPWQHSPATGDVEATFAIQGLERGRYFLRPGGMASSITADTDYTHRPIDVTDGVDIRDIVVTLATDGASVSGPVSDSDGIAPAGVTVVLFPVDRDQWTHFGRSPARIKTTTVFPGRPYRLTRLPAGDYFIVAVDAERTLAWHNPKFFAAASLVAGRVTLGTSASLTHGVIVRRVVTQ